MSARIRIDAKSFFFTEIVVEFFAPLLAARNESFFSQTANAFAVPKLGYKVYPFFTAISSRRTSKQPIRDPMLSMLEWLCAQLMEAEVSGLVCHRRDIIEA
jgi:hypothetical protein